jgi:hypothetical protein
MTALLKRTHLAGQLLRTQGPGWLAFRVGHALRLRSGLLRHQLPATSWDEQPLTEFLRDPALARPEAYLTYRRGHAPPFFFATGDRDAAAPRLRGWDEGRTGPVELMDEFGRGVFRFFEHTPAMVGCPPDWHANPFTGERTPEDRHWSRIGDFGQGDIKAIWEPSRFGFAYTLVRAYWRTGDEAHAERFWQLVESWQARNPPQQGANWKCGQETSLRVLAWCFGLYGFLDARTTTAERVAALAQMVAVSGQRIEAVLSYALSQRTNHGISEGVGLWTIGLLFPELRPAVRWRDRGRRVLEDLGLALIYEDGSFAQHSVNYHRLMLHDYLWAIRLGDLHGRPLSAGLRERVGRAGELLFQLQDIKTGRVPYYGQNDGALILPLSNCDYHDFRPVVQAIRYLTTGTRRYGDGPWDEDLYWLFGAESLNRPVVALGRSDLQAEAGGYYTLRSAHGFAFTRCATFRHRPGQADLLHVDLWWRGQNIALDAGTYSYNASPPWDNALAHTAYHNTVGVDGLSQMDQVGRFLWLPWARGRKRCRADSAGGQLAYWEGEHDGYTRLPEPVAHRRGVLRLGDEHWLVLDALQSRGEHRYRLHWLLPDLPATWEPGPDRGGQSGVTGFLTLATPVGPFTVGVGWLGESQGDGSLARAEVDSPRGWRALYYLHRQPALSLAADRRAADLRFWTVFGPPGTAVTADAEGLRVTGPGGRAAVRLGVGERSPLVTDVRLEREEDVVDQVRIPTPQGGGFPVRRDGPPVLRPSYGRPKPGGSGLH